MEDKREKNCGSKQRKNQGGTAEANKGKKKWQTEKKKLQQYYKPGSKTENEGQTGVKRQGKNTLQKTQENQLNAYGSKMR